MPNLVKGMYGNCPHCGELFTIRKEKGEYKITGVVGKKVDDDEENENQKSNDNDDFFE